MKIYYTLKMLSIFIKEIILFSFMIIISENSSLQKEYLKSLITMPSKKKKCMPLTSFTQLEAD